ncbi:winged helix-turn-helix domain-containing protein [Streptomyces liangshanensis]|uniref:winged helix-turn-helix domain-containing protein n=1 Tax=Streptomyces liangshanensis TaxID=2717324 RepID=UPI0036DC05DA
MREVQVVRWPTERTRLDALRRDGVPCLIVVASGTAVPTLRRTCEDWVRAGADPSEIRARLSSLRTRAIRDHRPSVDEEGILRFRGSLAPLTSTEVVVVSSLLEYVSTVVEREAIAARLAAANRSSSRNALDLHIMRLRKKLRPLGLSIETVHGRGYVLGAIKDRGEVPSAPGQGVPRPSAPRDGTAAS